MNIWIFGNINEVTKISFHFIFKTIQNQKNLNYLNLHYKFILFKINWFDK